MLVKIKTDVPMVYNWLIVMRTIIKKIIIVVCVVSMGFFYSCSKDDNNSNNNSLVGTSWIFHYGTSEIEEGITINFITEFDGHVVDWKYINGEYVEDYVTQINYVYNAPKGVITTRDGYSVNFIIDGNIMICYDREGPMTFLKQ